MGVLNVKKIFWTSFSTSWGHMIIAASARGIARVGLPGESANQVLGGFRKVREIKLVQEETPLLRQAREELQEFLRGERKDFDVPLDLRGTPFQKRVWGALRSVPYGETRSYQDVARKTGNMQATRAVGMANNRNPVPILVPCHRVVGKDGSMTGYGGGLEVKRRLLKLESGNTHLR